MIRKNYEPKVNMNFFCIICRQVGSARSAGMFEKKIAFFRQIPLRNGVIFDDTYLYFFKVTKSFQDGERLYDLG